VLSNLVSGLTITSCALTPARQWRRRLNQTDSSFADQKSVVIFSSGRLLYRRRPPVPSRGPVQISCLSFSHARRFRSCETAANSVSGRKRLAALPLRGILLFQKHRVRCRWRAAQHRGQRTDGKRRSPAGDPVPAPMRCDCCARTSRHRRWRNRDVLRWASESRSPTVSHSTHAARHCLSVNGCSSSKRESRMNRAQQVEGGPGHVSHHSRADGEEHPSQI
jgi:hypothetical protein